MITGTYLVLIGIVLVLFGALIDRLIKDVDKENINNVIKRVAAKKIGIMEARAILAEMVYYEPYLRDDEILALKFAIEILDEKIRNEDDLK